MKKRTKIIIISSITIILLIITIILYFTGVISQFYNSYIKNAPSNQNVPANNSQQTDSLSDTSTDSITDSSKPDESSNSAASANNNSSTEYVDRTDYASIHIQTSGSISSTETYTECTISTSDCDKQYEFNNLAAGIRLRGNSTTRFSKKPYRIKFNESTQLFGLSTGPSKSWVLLAEYCDYSMLRNTITFNLANRLNGIEFAPDCMFVELYINDNYNGLYLLTEQVQVSNDRVNIDESGTEDPSITDTGYLLELEASSSRRNEEGVQGTDWFAVTGYAGNSNSSHNSGFANNSFGRFSSEHSTSYDVAYYMIKSDTTSPSQVEYIQNYIIQVYDAIYKDKSYDSISKLVDIDSAVDMYILQLLCSDYDNNFSSSYIYKDKGGKLFFGPPWDFDLSYGNYSGHTGYDKTYMFHLLSALGEYEWFTKLVKTRFNELCNGDNSPINNMLKSINTYSSALSEQFTKNYNSIYTSSNNSFSKQRNFNQGHHLTYSSQTEAAEYLYKWLQNRISYIQNTLNS